MKKNESFKDFKKRVRHNQDSLFSILFIVPFTVRVAYLIKKLKWDVDPNNITFIRLFYLFFAIIILLFLAPILMMKELYLAVVILFYFSLFTDWLDGQVARGLYKKSEKGMFLDAIADRTAIIIFFVLLISMGLWANDFFLIYGGVFLFVVKTFHLMIISKIFFYEKDTGSNRNSEMVKIFGGREALGKMKVRGIITFVNKMNKKYFKIKRWNPWVMAPERYFITIMLPALFIYLGLDQIAIYMGYFFVITFSLFFLLRLKNLFRDYLS